MLTQYFIPIIILYTHNNIFYSIHSNKDYRIQFKYTQNVQSNQNSKNRKIEQLAPYMKYIQMVKTISLTTNFKTNIPPAKMKIHVSRISCQNFSLIWQLTKQESSFYQ